MISCWEGVLLREKAALQKDFGTPNATLISSRILRSATELRGRKVGEIREKGKPPSG